MFDSYDILVALKKLDLLTHRDSWWWPNALSFEVVVGAILTQNTKWENVEKSLQSLKNHLILSDNESSLKNIAQMNPDVLASHIASSGFLNQKSVRLILLCQNILDDFGSFDVFLSNVDRQWLLSQKGIGKESADSILNYACAKEVMVVDKYTYKFLCSLGVDIPDYDELQSYFQNGINANIKRTLELYDNKIPLAQIYARFHGKIVEFSKKKMKLEL
ncbi:3-methyladenine DNA glycosylase [Helicobacter cappadocius]|uniref:3-methyladenine DNA glycosylase n=1 Tax=Helicobacter cappadocius TaxID=3063998 RepID=A0AA90PJT9_9HELI|nr:MULTISPECIES: 3-methyladenine DNA glycosylase [unclassified Helicobacter]MDO7253319.1 3-methyladenine DNA glycosylase [Helicobacter sp. faydin-H75]MDP2539251.1 3-methyladenine DNA glycosylase [Helicobacter sp. faydin-H76]